MNLKELKIKHNLTEGQLTLLFDVLYLYHEYDLLYSFEELELLFNATKYFEKPDSYYLKSLMELLEMELLEFVNDREAKFLLLQRKLEELNFSKS